MNELPRGSELSPWVPGAEAVGALMEGSLLGPVTEFLGRPSKKFRAELVRLAFQGAGGKGEGWRPGAELLEHIHAGSLVVDDIQDDSLERRGGPTLHRTHGVPLALNAGNWLYFWPLEQVRRWGLAPEIELKVYRVCVDALLKAHFGQALDVGVGIDTLPRSEIPRVSLTALELKTGALTALATALGAVLGGATDDRLLALTEFGRRFGVALQMLDDLGNFAGIGGPADPKRWEDLKLRRPSWVWASVAQHGDEGAFADFLVAVRALPDEGPLARWARAVNFGEDARKRALGYLNAALDGLEQALGPCPPMEEIRGLGTALGNAYVKAKG